jgi:hypothetical protein
MLVPLLAGCFLVIGLLLVFLFYPEYGGCTFLRNIGGPIGLHGIASQKVVLFLVSVVRASSPEWWLTYVVMTYTWDLVKLRHLQHFNRSCCWELNETVIGTSTAHSEPVETGVGIETAAELSWPLKLVGTSLSEQEKKFIRIGELQITCKINNFIHRTGNKL